MILSPTAVAHRLPQFRPLRSHATLLDNGVLLVTGGAVHANQNVSDPFGNWRSSTELCW
jgi:hypothetical protein